MSSANELLKLCLERFEGNDDTNRRMRHLHLCFRHNCVLRLCRWPFSSRQENLTSVSLINTMTPIYGTWNNPADRRCNSKAGYPNMTLAENRAAKATAKAGHLIIAYQCFDCGAFHIGRADESQNTVRQQEVKTESLPKCILCGEMMQCGLTSSTPILTVRYVERNDANDVVNGDVGPSGAGNPRSAEIELLVSP
jgi:hypothetical protein